MSYTNPENKTCLRCGFSWMTRWRYLRQGETATEPKRCARCRSPLWNTPKTLNSGPKSQLEIQRERDAQMARDAAKVVPPRKASRTEKSKAGARRKTSHRGSCRR